MKKFIFLFIYFYYSIILFANGKLTIAVIGQEPNLRANIESTITNSDFLQAVERNRIDTMLTEMKLGQQGVLKEGSYAKAGETLGASYIVLVEKNSNAFRLVHTQSSRILGSWTGWNDKSSQEFLTILEREKSLQELANLKSAGKKDYKIEVTNAIGSKENGGVKIGDEIKIEFIVKSKKEKYAYVTILVYGQDGSITQLFPNKYQSDNKIETNIDFSFPPPDAPKKYKLIASQPIGEDTMVIIASDSSVALEDGSPLGIYFGNTKSLKGTKGITLQ
ncbi:MAG TPA: DUF4384 domain-containing protein [Leptospiraceae bacterium]|nr:DUF4384 domain-containing protein [Leptospiraceae bacterium]